MAHHIDVHPSMRDYYGSRLEHHIQGIGHGRGYSVVISRNSRHAGEIWNLPTDRVIRTSYPHVGGIGTTNAHEGLLAAPTYSPDFVGSGQIEIWRTSDPAFTTHALDNRVKVFRTCDRAYACGIAPIPRTTDTFLIPVIIRSDG